MINGLTPDTIQWRRRPEADKASYARLSLKIGARKAAWLAGVSDQGMYRWRRKYLDLAKYETIRKLSLSQVKIMRRLHERYDYAPADLAAQYGVHRQTVYKILSGTRYPTIAA